MSGSEDRAFQALIEDLQSGALSYEDARRRYMELGDKIRERYEKELTALAVDVVDSHGLKQFGTALEAQATFDAYHRWVDEKLAQYGCVDRTWAGDGLLALFETPEDAVSVARSLLDGLPTFNARYNRLRGGALQSHALQIRAGVHTGPVLTDPTTLGTQSGLVGRIASDTIDLAGHLQKSAAVNQISISPTTYSKLGEGAGQFVKVQREMPNPGTCFVYPPRSDGDPYVHTAHTAGGTQSTGMPAAVPPVGRQASSPLPWIAIGASMLAVGAVVGIAFMVSHLQQPEGGPGGGSRPFVLQPHPVAPTQTNGTPAPPPSGQPVTPAVATPAGTPPAATGSGTTPVVVDAGPEPARQLWISPDANSGVPARVVQSPPEARWLLAVGVGSYRDRTLSAEGAAADARTAAQLLQRAAAIPANHVQVLTDEQATLHGIRSAIQALQASVTSGKDTILVYLAGAGLNAPARPGTSGGTAYAFAPYDANSQDLTNTAIYGSDLAAWLGAAHAQAVIVFADTSYGGAMEYPTRADQGRQYAVLSSAGAGQRTGRGVGGGAFVEALAQALSGAADGDRDRQVSLDELQQYLRAEVPRRTGGAQNPDVHAGFGGFLPEFKFAAGG